MTDASFPIADSELEYVIGKVAPRNWDVLAKLVEGAQAQAALAIREREEMAAELAELKQKQQKIAAYARALVVLIEQERKE